MMKQGRSAAIAVALLFAACGDPSAPSNSDASSVAAGGHPSGSSIASILDLGTLGGAGSAAYGLNDKGQIVGESRTRAGSQHAFVWANGVMTDLGVLAGAAHSVAYDINEAGVIVGASGIRPVRWVPTGGGYGAAQDLGSLGGCCGDAQAVNDGGRITGSSTHLIPNPSPDPPDTAWHAYLWQNGSMSDIHPLTLFGESDQTFPWAINNAGTVVGQQYKPSRGFYRLSDGSARLLAGLGGAGSVPIDINNAGTIVGWSQATPSDQQPWHATLWSNGVPQDLGTLGGTSSVAIAISDDPNPRVVGRADTGRGQRAFVWIQGQGMKDLGLPKGGSFGQAWDINGSGWIVGEISGRSGQSRATLWKLAAP